MANAAGGEGSRGKIKGSEQGIAGVRLQNLLPRARVLYASANAATSESSFVARKDSMTPVVATSSVAVS